MSLPSGNEGSRVREAQQPVTVSELYSPNSAINTGRAVYELLHLPQLTVSEKAVTHINLSCKLQQFYEENLFCVMWESVLLLLFLHVFYLRDRCVPYTASNTTTKPPNNSCKYFLAFYTAKHFSGKKHLSAT